MLKIGIIGTGAIASQFIKEANMNKRVDVVAVTARDYAKTTAFAEKWGIPTVYKTVDALLENTEIEAIYIATLHPTHPYYAIKGLEAGKHVLSEKPAALTVAQIDKITTLAKQKNKLFMEAMTVGFNPLYQEIKGIIKSGKIGTVTHVESMFGRMSAKDHKHTPEQAGGCIYDIGIYNIFLILDLLGPVKKIQLQGKKHRAWDVIGTVQLLAEHQNGGQSYSYMTMDSISTSKAAIIGTEGTIEIGEGWTTPHEYKVSYRDGTFDEVKIEDENWLGYELEAFVELVETGETESKIMPYQMSLEIQKTIESIYSELEIELPTEAILV